MKSKGDRMLGRLRMASRRAFAILELAVVITTLFVISGLLLPAIAKTRSHTNAAIDLSNVHQILRAVHTYANEHTDYCPAPGWGTTANCWLYGANIPATPLFGSATQAQIDKAVSNQVVYFLKGELAAYLGGNQKIVECPTDVAMRRSGNYKLWYNQRGVLLTSYGFSGAVSGFGAPKQVATANLGGAYKLSDFRPSSFLFWEPDETVPFNFNDAAMNQENATEGVSRRHTASPTGPSVHIGDGAMVATFGGSASYINPKIFTQLRAAPAENDLRCGPGYR